jgi:uncharacterized protein
MRLTVTSSEQRLLIRGYAGGVLRVGDRQITTPVALSATEVHGTLQAQEPTALTEAELASVFEAQPEVVIIGWARGQFFLPAAQRRWFLERRIGLELMDLGAACRTFNVLVADDRRVIGLLFPR